MAQNEDADRLEFGEDFKDVSCLTNAEVAMILSKIQENRMNLDVRITPAFTKTLQHCKCFSEMGEGQGVMEAKELRQALESYEHVTEDGVTVKLRPFEVAALANLMSEYSTSEEAVALIPSLRQFFMMEEVEAVLEIIRTKGRKVQTS